jgi:hypothetical protein
LTRFKHILAMMFRRTSFVVIEYNHNYNLISLQTRQFKKRKWI